MLKQAYQQGFQAALTKFAAGLPPFSLRQVVPHAAVGGGLGLLRYGLSDDPDKTLLGSVGGGAAIGAGVGGLAQAGMRHIAKNNPEYEKLVLDTINKSRANPGVGGSINRFMYPQSSSPIGNIDGLIV